MNIYSIDHGNESIKTRNTAFPCGLAIYDTEPPMASEWIVYKGKYYVLSKTALKYKMDKTIDNTYLVFTLFGLARDAEKGAIDLTEPIFLAMGLPPMHMGILKAKFLSYFKEAFDAGVSFIYHRGKIDKAYDVKASGYTVYPQGFACAYAYSPRKKVNGEMEKPNDLLAEYPDWLMIDIGGYTVDVIYFEGNQPQVDKSSTKEIGVIRMCEKIAAEISMETGIKLNKHDIETTLRGKKNLLGPEVKAQIDERAKAWADVIISDAAEKVDDLRTVPILFCGGGALLLRKYLENNSNLSGVVSFINDVKANAWGYYYLAKGEGK